MGDNFLNTIWTKFAGAMEGLFSAASGGISGYVIPIAWVVLAIILLFWSYMTMSGKTSVPVLSWFVPVISFMLVLHIMGSGYMEWVANPLWNLPNELVTATGKGSAAGSGATDTGPIAPIVTAWKQYVTLTKALGAILIDYFGHGAIGAGVVLVIIVVLLSVSMILLTVATFCGMLYAKLGLTLVLAVGPFFIFLLVIPQLRDRFFSWLNTALYFVFYYVLCNLYMALFFKFITGYMDGVVNTAAAVGSGDKYENWADHGFEIIYNVLGGGNADKMGNIVGQFLPLVAIAFIMAFMFLQLSTIASSMTSGAGGAVGQGASSLFYYIKGITRGSLSKGK